MVDLFLPCWVIWVQGWLDIIVATNVLGKSLLCLHIHFADGADVGLDFLVLIKYRCAGDDSHRASSVFLFTRGQGWRGPDPLTVGRQHSIASATVLLHWVDKGI